MENKGQTKTLQLVNTISEKGDILKQRNLQGLKAEAIEQMLQEEDENDESYSDVESDGDSPKKTDEDKKAPEYRSNQTKNKEANIKGTSIVHRPIYMQQSS